MRPSDFILNTDYLSLAQTNKADFTAFFAPETFAAGDHERTQDFTIKKTQGAIDRVLMSHNNGQFIVGDKLIIQSSPNNVYVNVFRTNPSTIRVRLHVSASSSYSMPTQNIRIKIAGFQPPNIY